eukprot:TRINITY_DN2623_c0_g1_i1.p1 TRINITY_DN2623_c0_g1~~TRINITY_DN2623_c0_g1_i1.p1  ORF type:complete len:132 (+),score=10.53 TRINITY_DN2623_c0_g1_i1:143-538(+)
MAVLNMNDCQVPEEISACCVCMEANEVMTSCGHSLCTDCYLQIRNSTCPLCRAELPDIDGTNGMTLGSWRRGGDRYAEGRAGREDGEVSPTATSAQAPSRRGNLRGLLSRFGFSSDSLDSSRSDGATAWRR